MLYAGREAVVTGFAALLRHGAQVPSSDRVDILLPVSRRRQSCGFVVVHRTNRMPESLVLADGLRYAPIVRAVADAVRAGMESRPARALVADAVQRYHCAIQDLAAELMAGQPQGTAVFREVLAEVADGIGSAAEGDLRRLIIRSGLPAPLYNPKLYVGSTFLARPDAWWPDAGVACEVDSRAWHLSPDDWERTQARHARMSANGVIVLHYPPRRLRADAKAVVAELRSAIVAGRRSPPLAITTVPFGQVASRLGA